MLNNCDRIPEVAVSVVIPCHNRWSFLPKVMSGILSQTFTDWEIILIDDASDSTSSELRLNEKTKYFRLNERRGSGYARNFGAKQCRGKFILFVDDDVILSPTYIASILKVFYDHPEAGAVGGRLFYVKEGEYYSSERYYDKPVRFGGFSGEVLGGFSRKTRDVVEVPVLHVVSLLKREDFLALGGFDELTYIGNRYREETDLFLRIRKTGRKLFFCPTALAYHFAVGSGGQRMPLLKNEYYVFLNQAQFLKKYYADRWIFMLVFFVFRRYYDRAVQLFVKVTKPFNSEKWRKFSERMEG